MLDRVLRFTRQSAFASGIRSTAGTLVPLFIGVVTGQIGFWMQVAIGGLLVSSADVGGTKRNKATVMIAATAAGATTCLLGTLAGNSIGLAVPLMFAVAFCGGMTNAFGNRATAVGTVMVMAFVFRLAPPNTLDAGLERAIGFIAGGAWAMALSLWLWPTRPFQVAAEAIELLYRQLAVYIGGVGTPQADALRGAVEAAHTRARNAILAVRATLTGQSAIGQRLILLSSSGDSLFHAVVGLKEEAAIASSHPGFGALAPKLHTFTQALSAATDQIAAAVAAYGGDVDGAVVQSAARDVDETITALTRASSDPKAELPDVSDLCNLAQACAYAAACVQTAMDCVRVRSDSEREHAADGIAPAPTPASPSTHWRAVASKVRDNLTLQSLPFRHALRLAATVSLGVFIYKLFDSDHGYWLPLAVVMIMKPNFGATRKRATEAAIGTVIGGTIATALSILVTNNYLQMALMVPLGLIAFAAMPRSYVQYMTLFTPFFILMIDIMSPGNWMFGLERIGYMIGGATLSVLAANVLWPSWERDYLPQQLGRTVNANRAYLSAVLSAYVQPPGDKSALHETLERANLENVNAEASFQRLVNEPKSQQGDIAPAYALVTYNQRIFDATTALAMRRRDAGSGTAVPDLATRASQMDASLNAIAQGLQTGRPAQPMTTTTLTANAAGGNQLTPDAVSVQSELTRLAQAITDMARLATQMTVTAS
jgi:uncharacterized membrane protein YccC